MRRWEAMPELKFAELIDGVVYMPSPLACDHGGTDFWCTTWLGHYVVKTPGSAGGCQGTWLMLDSVPQPDNYVWIRPEFGGQSTIQGKYHAGAPSSLPRFA